MNILAHRGLDLDRAERFAENSLRSFQWAMGRGFGIELDLQQLADGELIVVHDATTDRWSHQNVRKPWTDLDLRELTILEKKWGSICRLREVLELCRRSSVAAQVAIHIKSFCQTPRLRESLVPQLKQFADQMERLLIFDLSFAFAQALRAELPHVALAASIADADDRQRYGDLTGGTLLPLKQVLSQTQVFNWVWLDEWRRTGLDGQTKSLYTAEILASCRAARVKVALISPELHRADGHEDSLSEAKLEARWRDLLGLQMETICTDYPTRLARFGG